MNKRDLAELLGISEVTLTAWQKAGMPMGPRAARGEPNEYDSEKVIRWWIKREVQKASDEQPRDRRDRLQADEIEHRLKEKRGELIPAAAIRPAWIAQVVAARQAIRAVPAEVAPAVLMLRSEDEVRDFLEERLDDALTKLAAADDKPRAKRPAARGARALGAAAENVAVGLGGTAPKAAGGVGGPGRVPLRADALPARDP